MPKSKYYGVRVGHNIGIYSTWDECLEQVNKFSKARYKKFYICQAAQDFIDSVDAIHMNKKNQTTISVKDNNIVLIN